MKILTSRKFYFLLSFIEGGSVMAAELLGAKMLAPYFGSSLYVWASVLAITLGGLAAGYYAGGVVSQRRKQPLALFYVLVAAAAFTMLMPFTSKLVLWAVGMHSLIPAVIVSSLCILFPPVFMMGMVSPLIIRAITRDVDESGRAAGAIYAVSTVGGILATFTFGFYVIPRFGLTYPSIFTGIVLGAIPLWVVIRSGGKMKAAAFLVLAAWSIWTARTPASGEIKVHLSEEGLLGQVMVLDYPRYEDDGAVHGFSRWLFVNRISQTMLDPLADESRGEEKYFTYVYRIMDHARKLPKGSRVLLLGLGGGSVAQTLSSLGMKVEVCELDRRIADVAKKYFLLPGDVTVHVDDARHFIRTCNDTYDLVIFDTFKGEDPPNHVFTMESLAETKKLLNPGALVMVNSLGYLDGSIGRSMRSIYRTFQESGFNVEILPTDPDPNQRNLLFYASLGKVPAMEGFVPAEKIRLEDALVLRDDRPVLDILNAEAAHRWRVLAIGSFGSDPRQQVIPVFN